MNKNTVIGFVLIGLILIGFSWYNTKNFKEQERARFVADSIARVEALKNAPKVDSAVIQLKIRNTPFLFLLIHFGFPPLFISDIIPSQEM